MGVLRWITLCLTWIMLAEVTSTLSPVDLVDMDWNFPLSVLGLILSPAGTDWTSWDLDLGFLALLALAPSIPNLDLLTFLGVPSSLVGILRNPASPLGLFCQALS